MAKSNHFMKCLNILVFLLFTITFSAHSNSYESGSIPKLTFWELLESGGKGHIKGEQVLNEICNNYYVKGGISFSDKSVIDSKLKLEPFFSKKKNSYGLELDLDGRKYFNFLIDRITWLIGSPRLKVLVDENEFDKLVDDNALLNVVKSWEDSSPSCHDKPRLREYICEEHNVQLEFNVVEIEKNEIKVKGKLIYKYHEELGTDLYIPGKWDCKGDINENYTFDLTFSNI